MDEFDEAIYQANFTLEQTDSSGNLVLKVKSDNGTRLLLNSISLHGGGGASGLRLEMYIYDSSNNIIQLLGLDTSFGGILTFPSTGSVASNDNNKSAAQNVVLANGDYLWVRYSSASTNETISARLRGYIRGRLPNVDTSSSGGTVSLTTAYHRIV